MLKFNFNMFSVIWINKGNTIARRIEIPKEIRLIYTISRAILKSLYQWYLTVIKSFWNCLNLLSTERRRYDILNPENRITALKSKTAK